VEKLAPNAEQHNYAKVPLRRKDLEAILAAAGSVAEVLNTRHKTAKENGWKEKAPSKTAFIKAALEEPNLLRRPIVLRGKKIVVGKDLDGIRKLLR
jgi:arsenate reductase-like glutaredoxin family protein